MINLEQARINYDRKYKDFEPEYTVEYVRDWIQRHTPIMDYAGGTLLDIGCGLGDWSVGLAGDFKVTGVDISGVAVERGRSRSNKVTFIQSDVFDLRDKYDVVFCRGLSAFNESPANPSFQIMLSRLFRLTNKLFLCCLWTEQPYGERYRENDSREGWYKHDPKVIGELFSRYGNSHTSIADGYLVGEITREIVD